MYSAHIYPHNQENYESTNETGPIVQISPSLCSWFDPIHLFFCSPGWDKFTDAKRLLLALVLQVYWAKSLLTFIPEYS